MSQLTTKDSNDLATEHSNANTASKPSKTFDIIVVLMVGSVKCYNCLAKDIRYLLKNVPIKYKKQIQNMPAVQTMNIAIGPRNRAEEKLAYALLYSNTDVVDCLEYEKFKELATYAKFDYNAQTKADYYFSWRVHTDGYSDSEDNSDDNENEDDCETPLK